MSKPSFPSKPPVDPYDIFIIAITCLSFLSLIVLTLPYFDTSAQQIALSLDLILSLLFMLDFFYTLTNSADKRVYLKWGWLDFLGSLPYLPFLRILRIFRALRSLRVLQHNNMQEIGRAIKRRPERTTFFSVVLLSIVFISLSSYAILYTEKLAPEGNIENASEALWWSIVTITTVGYGDYVPVTNGGRIVAMVLMLMGIGIFGALTSYLSTIFINQDKRTTDKFNKDVIRRLESIEERLRILSEKNEE